MWTIATQLEQLEHMQSHAVKKKERFGKPIKRGNIPHFNVVFFSNHRAFENHQNIKRHFKYLNSTSIYVGNHELIFLQSIREKKKNQANLLKRNSLIEKKTEICI